MLPACKQPAAPVSLETLAPVAVMRRGPGKKMKIIRKMTEYGNSEATATQLFFFNKKTALESVSVYTPAYLYIARKLASTMFLGLFHQQVIEFVML